jgi:FMNH2-dependent dimethyl sulfone monooxygenase
MIPARTIKAEVTRGPYDPGGQPESRTGQPLEVSLFAWNIRGGLCGSKATLSDPDRYRDYWQWPIASQLLREAERIGMDGQFQFGMWKGFPGPAGWATSGLEWSTASAAASAITERMVMVSTAHLGFGYHPVHLAKMGGCLDHISNGRWRLNIVAGQLPDDFRMFGMKDIPSGAERYAICDEFTTLMKMLWHHDEPIDFEGEYFQAYGARIEPKPVQSPRPVLINAGQSEAGMDFACRQTDMVFVAPGSARIEDFAALTEELNRRASSYGRKIRVAALSFVVMDETDEAARSTMQWLEDEIDHEAVSTFFGAAAGTSNAIDADESDPWLGIGREEFLRVGLGLTGIHLTGSYETVAEQMRGLYDAGVEHICLGFFDPARGLRQMEEHMLPLLKKMNLRV